MIELLQYEFIRNAALSGIFVSIACGIIGSLVVVNRMVFVSGGIAHAAYGGIGLAVLFGFSPLLGAGIFSVFTAMVIGVLTLRRIHRIDAVIGALWAAGMAVGIIALDRSHTYSADLMSYLFGSILTVPGSDLWFGLALDICIAAFVLFSYHDLLALSFDAEFASLRSVPVAVLRLALLAAAAITVVITMRLVGLILVIALISIPPSICEDFADSMWKLMALSSVLGAGFTLTGLWLSIRFDIPTGAAIIIVASGTFFLHFIFRGRKKRGPKPATPLGTQSF